MSRWCDTNLIVDAMVITMRGVARSQYIVNEFKSVAKHPVRS